MNSLFPTAHVLTPHKRVLNWTGRDVRLLHAHVSFFEGLVAEFLSSRFICMTGHSRLRWARHNQQRHKKKFCIATASAIFQTIWTAHAKQMDIFAKTFHQLLGAIALATMSQCVPSHQVSSTLVWQALGEMAKDNLGRTQFFLSRVV